MFYLIIGVVIGIIIGACCGIALMCLNQVSSVISNKCYDEKEKENEDE